MIVIVIAFGCGMFFGAIPVMGVKGYRSWWRLIHCPLCGVRKWSPWTAQKHMRGHTATPTFELEILDLEGQPIVGPLTMEHLYYIAKCSGLDKTAYHLSIGVVDNPYRQLGLTLRVTQVIDGMRSSYCLPL